MKQNINLRRAMFGRVDTYGIEHPFTPTNERANGLFTELKVVITDMNAAIQTQESGLGEQIGATGDLRRVEADLRNDLRDLIKTAKTFDPEEFPGVGEEFRMPRSQKMAVLAGVAHGFLGKLTNPLKAAFIAHGLRADFDEQIQTKTAFLTEALTRQNAGVITRKRGTLGLNEKSRRGMEIVRALDAIHRNKLRGSDPVLFGVWNAAKRLESMPVRAKFQGAQGSEPAPSGSSTQPASAPPTGSSSTSPVPTAAA